MLKEQTHATQSSSYLKRFLIFQISKYFWGLGFVFLYLNRLKNVTSLSILIFSCGLVFAAENPKVTIYGSGEDSIKFIETRNSKKEFVVTMYPNDVFLNSLKPLNGAVQFNQLYMNIKCHREGFHSIQEDQGDQTPKQRMFRFTCITKDLAPGEFSQSDVKQLNATYCTDEFKAKSIIVREMCKGFELNK